MTSNIIEIPIDMIKPNPNNPRKNFTNINELAEDIKKNGLIHKILVRPINDLYEIVQGERRYTALQLLQRNIIEVEVRELTDQQAEDIMLSENISREDLSPIELANEFKRRLETQNQEELAKQIGKSQSFISQTLKLLELPPLSRMFLDIKIITREHARELLRFKKYLRMLKYDTFFVYEFENRKIYSEESLISQLSDRIIDRGWDSKQLSECVDIAIFDRIRHYLNKEKEEYEIPSNDKIELIKWILHKSMDWCNHNPNASGEYCLECGKILKDSYEVKNE